MLEPPSDRSIEMADLSPLRRRMIEDMTVRNLSPATQRSYINAVSKLSRYFGRSPERLELECVLACNFDPPVNFGRRLTLLRFDPVYAGHFKCNRRRIADYKNLSGYRSHKAEPSTLQSGEAASRSAPH